MTVSIHVNINDLKDIISDSRIKFARVATANQMLHDMDQFIPYKTGELRASGHVNEDGSQIIWDKPYAMVQYTGQFNHKKVKDMTDKARRYFFAAKLYDRKKGYTTKGTGPHWDEVAEKKDMSTWLEVFGRGLTHGKT
ncbi:minor capsid protein [Oenococcus phage vB_OeS_unk162]|nr:minor capsid protein [Oenococcus phage vB_OeS_unk162]QNO11524.1 hypothetical protein [Oenococcus phage Vinitor-27]